MEFLIYSVEIYGVFHIQLTSNCSASKGHLRLPSSPTYNSPHTIGITCLFMGTAEIPSVSLFTEEDDLNKGPISNEVSNIKW